MAQEPKFWEAVVGLLLAFGIAGGVYRYAYSIARWNEMMDSIGSTTPMDEIEPAPWYVGLIKLFAVGIALLGIAWFLDVTALVEL